MTDVRRGPLPSDHIPIASSSRRPPPTCPMSNTSPPRSAPPAKCPIDYEQRTLSESKVNPLNSIPLDVSATSRAAGQILHLPTEREISTIPRPKAREVEDTGPTWEYPSPQQFYNALVRKGWETPEESIEMVVQIHNFLNEMAWEEVMKWERRLPG